MSKKISHKNEFELCYMRHKYLSKAKKDVTEEEMKPYMEVVNHFSVNTFYMYKSIFQSIGMLLEDVISISQVHLVSYIGLFSLEADRKRMSKFRKIFKNKNKRKPAPEDLLQKNIANFVFFLKQRMEDLVRICKQKMANIKGRQADPYIVFKSSHKPTPEDIQFLSEVGYKYKRAAKLGFKKVNNYVFQTVKKYDNKKEKNLFYFNNEWYTIVEVNNRELTVTDLDNSFLRSWGNTHTQTPEEIMICQEKDDEMQEMIYYFGKMEDEEKIKVFKDFIDKNKSDPAFKQERSEAKKQIKLLERKLSLNGR